MKRAFDIVFSIIALLLLSPLILFISVGIILDSKGGVFFRQKRIGLHEKPFLLFKFRSMFLDSERNGQLTLGNKDARITSFGRVLRRSKMDEIPQLLNVLKGEMSVVGPRPEVEKYVKLYTLEQKKIFQIKPGLTDYASIKYIDEDEVLAASETPEYSYIHTIMPDKLKINLDYLENNCLLMDMRILFATFKKLVMTKKGL